MKTCVIGAGVTGLTFAKLFSGAQVFESGPAIGGKAATAVVDTKAGPFVFDAGGHWFHHQNSPEILKLLDGLPLIKHERKAFVLLEGELYDFPIQSSYSAIPDPALVRRIDNELLLNRNQKNTAENYADLLLQTYGETLYASFFHEYNQKMYGVADLTQIPVGKYDTVRNVPLNNTNGYNNEFYYSADNHGAMGIPFHLSEGLSITCNASVHSICLKSKTLQIGEETLPWDKLISTMPLPALLKNISDADPAMLLLAKQLQASRGFIVNLGIRKTAHHQNMDWVYVPSMEYHFYRIGFYSHIQPLAAPDGYDGMYVECSPLFFSNKAEAYALIPILIDELIELGFIHCKEDIMAVNPIYLEHNYCLPNPDATSILLEYLSEHEIFSIGRYGSWHWSSQHEDMQQAIRLARELRANELTAWPVEAMTSD